MDYEIIKQVGDYLRQPLSKKNLKAQLLGLDSLRFELAKSRADAQQLLYEKRKQMLWPKDADVKLTELDRTVRLNGDVAILERDYQFLTRLEQIVDARLELGLALLDS